MAPSEMRWDERSQRRWTWWYRM